MQRARRFRGEQYDKDMFTNLPTSNRDALGEPSRKRKSSYNHQRSMASPTRGYGFPRRSGPKSYTDDLRDKELRSSIPASPHRESSQFRGYRCDSPHRESSHFRDHPCASPRRESSHFRDHPCASPRRESSHFRSYPRRTPSRDRKNYAESCHFNKRDHYETKSEHTEYSSLRGQLQSPHRKDLSPLSVRHTHKTLKWPASITEDSNQFDCREANEQKANDRNVSHFQKLRNCAPEKPDQMKVLATSSHDQSSENMGKSQNFHQLNKTGAFVVNIHESDCQTYRASRWSSLMTEAVSHFGSRESNAHIAREENACNYQEFHNSGLQRAEQVNVMASHSCDIRFKNPRESQRMQQSFLKPQAPAVGFDQKGWQTHKASEWPPEMAEDFQQPPNREADYRFGSHEPNARVAREDNASNYDEFRNSGLQRAEQVNVMASNSCDVGFKNLRESQSMQQSFLKPQAPAVGFDEKGQHTHKASEWPPAMAEHFDQQSNREQHASLFQEFQNFATQNLAQMKAVGSSSHEQASINIREPHSLKQNFLNPRGFGSDFDVKCSNQEIRKSESSSNVERIGEASTFTGFDNDKMFGDSAGSSECDLQHETSRLLQNALRLLSAASGIVSADNSGGEVQCQDNVKIMKLLLDSGIQNLKHSLVETTLSKKIEASPNLDMFGPNGEKDSVRLDDPCKLENKASAFTEKLWDGILQLSTSVSVSAAAFFKSGEKMQDFSWSGSVEVKGKVRLEAFEKYVQDLPRSRSRGLMVISFCCKEGLSGAGFKCMKEVAEKYKERKKVGFAQLSNGLDLYICPHSDAVITILAKHGFFKGMAAVRDKSDPLIGCVVWRKNPSSVPALKALEVNTPQSPSEPSLKSPSGSSALQVQSESSTMANKSQESISLSSSVGARTSKGDEPLGFETNMELEKFNLQPPTVVAENSAASSDDDDLPEYDFGAVVSQSSRNQTSDVGAIQSGFAAEKFGDSDVPRPLSNLMRSESSTLSRTLPDFHFQGLVSQGMGHQSSHSPSLPIEPQKQVRECKERSKLPDNYSQGPVPHNLERMHELHNSSLPVKQEKQMEKSPTTSKSGTLFNDDDDDDDIPEWCPPGFTKPGLEASQGAGPSFTLSHSKVPDSGFADSNSGPLPPRPPTPPPAQLHLLGKEYHFAPQLLTSIASRPSANGFVHNPDFARNPASRPQFDPKGIGNQVHHLAWRSSRP